MSYDVYKDKLNEVNEAKQFFKQEVEIITENKTTVRSMDDVTAIVFIENEKKKINDQFVALLYFKQ